MHCKRRGSEKSTSLLVFWGFCFSGCAYATRNASTGHFNPNTNAIETIAHKKYILFSNYFRDDTQGLHRESSWGFICANVCVISRVHHLHQCTNTCWKNRNSKMFFPAISSNMTHKNYRALIVFKNICVMVAGSVAFSQALLVDPHARLIFA